MPAHGARSRLIAALAAAAVLAGCGEDDPGPRSPGTAGSPGTGGALVWALPERPEGIDPLAASSREAQLVTRQIHEPLTESLAEPFGDVGRLQGLAISASGSAGETIWSFTLREGIRFQDGAPFNAAAVAANAERWRTSAEGRALLPGLFAADAPRPDLVRFFLQRPDPDFPELLSRPQTGIVSPRALDSRSGADTRLRRDLRSGTGPFELRERGGGGVVVARNLDWWGTERGLGPALDQVDFRVIPDPADRLALLEAGDIHVAEALGAAQVREARQDPLLEVLGGGDEALGIERSVRGITSATEIPSLSGVWVTRVGPG